MTNAQFQQMASVNTIENNIDCQLQHSCVCDSLTLMPEGLFFDLNKIKHANLWKHNDDGGQPGHTCGEIIFRTKHWNGLSSLPFLPTTFLFHSFILFYYDFDVSAGCRYQFYVRKRSSILSAVTQPAYVSYIMCPHLLHSKMGISCKKLL